MYPPESALKAENKSEKKSSLDKSVKTAVEVP